jgi:hypothetical protein
MPNLRQQIGDQLFRAELTKQFTNSSQKWTIICTSGLQVFVLIYKLNLQVRLRVKLQVILSVLISVLFV